MAQTDRTGRVAERIQVVANVCVIAAALLFVCSISWLFLRQYISMRVSHSSISKGTKITLPEFNWSLSSQSLLLVLSTECKYCSASTPFYRRLVNQARLTLKTRLLAIFPQAVNESREYFAKHDVKLDTVRQAVPASLGVKGTPTLILVDTNGVVIQSWDGMVPPEVENEILALLK